MKISINQTFLFTLCQFLIVTSCCKNDDTQEEQNNCPSINISTPEILGDWIFTGTISNGELIIDNCDLETKLNITETQFIWDNFSGENCNNLTVYTNCYSIENNIIYYYDEFGEKGDFSQEIITLNSTTLILQNISSGNSNNVATENFKRP